jgi:hypothetical protein
VLKENLSKKSFITKNGKVKCAQAKYRRKKKKGKKLRLSMRRRE